MKIRSSDFRISILAHICIPETYQKSRPTKVKPCQIEKLKGGIFHESRQSLKGGPTKITLPFRLMFILKSLWDMRCMIELSKSKS